MCLAQMTKIFNQNKNDHVLSVSTTVRKLNHKLKIITAHKTLCSHYSSEEEYVDIFNGGQLSDFLYSLQKIRKLCSFIEML
jgi:hypothetical protein